MASLYTEMRDPKSRHFSNSSVVALVSRTVPILPCSPTPARVLILILTRLFSRHSSIMGAFSHFRVCVINRIWTFACSAAITKTTMDDSSPNITYFPTLEDWPFAKVQGCFNDTLRCVLQFINLQFLVLMCSFIASYTGTGGAQAQIAFNGDAVAIYGTVSPYLTDYTVTTDGVMRSFQSSSKGLANNIHMDVSALITLTSRTNILIICRPCWSVQLSFEPDFVINIQQYFTDSLTSGQHHLTLTANPAHSGLYYSYALMGIDRIVVLNASNGTITKNDPGNSTQPSFVSLPQNSTGTSLALAAPETNPLGGINLA